MNHQDVSRFTFSFVQINTTIASPTLTLRSQLVGALGVSLVLILVILLSVRAVIFVRAEKTFRPPIELTCAIQFCLLFFSISDLPHFLHLIFFPLGIGVRRWPLTFPLHILSLHFIYTAFCIFALLWVEILNLSKRFKKVAVVLTASAALVALLADIAFIITFLSEEYTFDFQLHDIVQIWTGATLFMASTLFLIYGLYAQHKLNRIFWTGTAWQRQILRQVNQTVAMCTFCCFARAYMIAWIFLEEKYIVPAFFVNSSIDNHPFIWYFFSELLPLYGLGFILFRWTSTKAKGVKESTTKVTATSTGLNTTTSYIPTTTKSPLLWINTPSRDKTSKTLLGMGSTSPSEVFQSM